MRRCHLHKPSPKFLIDTLVRDDRNLDAGDGQPGLLADVRPAARVLGMYRDGGVAEHGLRTCGGDRDRSRPVGERVLDVVEIAVGVVMHCFFVGERREAMGAPVNHPVSSVDQSLVPEPYEDLAHGIGVGRIERKAGAAPVAGAADNLELLENCVAGTAHELPDSRHECLASQVEACLAFGRELFFNDILGRDARMIRSRQPLGGPAAHPLEADQHVLHDVVQRVPDVKLGRDVRRWDDDDIRIALWPRLKHAGVKPTPVENWFYRPRIVCHSLI